MRGEPRVPRLHKRRETGQPGRLLQNDGALLDARHFAQVLFDFLDLDPKAPNLHLKVDPSQVFQLSVGPPACEVSCPVEPDPARHRTGRG